MQNLITKNAPPIPDRVLKPLARGYGDEKILLLKQPLRVGYNFLRFFYRWDICQRVGKFKILFCDRRSKCSQNLISQLNLAGYAEVRPGGGVRQIIGARGRGYAAGASQNP